MTEAASVVSPGTPSVRIALRALVARLRAALPRSPWELAFDGLVLAFVTWMSYLSTIRYWTFETRGWDLGVYTLSWLSVAQLRSIPSWPHFSPIVYLFAPLLAAFPSAVTLLVLQAAALGGSGFGVYWLAREATRREWVAFTVASAYLVGFLPISIAWFDFHMEAFLPLFFLAALYARRRNSLRGFLLAGGLALASIEAAIPLLLVLVGAMLAASVVSRRLDAVARARERRFAVWGAVLAVGWLIGLVVVLKVAAAVGGSQPALLSEVVGAGGVGGPSVLSSPSVVFAQLVAGLGQVGLGATGKLTYVLILFGAFGFLALAGDLVELLPAVAWILFAAAAGRTPYLEFNDQYIAYALPFVAAAACSGLGRVSRWIEARPPIPAPTGLPASGPPTPRHRRPWTVTPVVVLVAGMAMTSAMVYPLLPSPVQSDSAVAYGLPTATDHQAVLREILATIPPDARVLTTNNLFPQLATDPNALLSPISPVLVANTTVQRFVAAQVAAAQYVLLDFTLDWTNAALVQLYGNWSDFHVVAAGSGIRLMERGPATAPVRWFGSETYDLPVGDFIPLLASRSATATGASLNYTATQRTSGFLWTGPYLEALAPGTYDVTLQLALDINESTSALELKAVHDGLEFVARSVPAGAGLERTTYALLPAAGNQTVLADTYLESSPGLHPYTVTFTIDWTEPGFLELDGLNPSTALSVWFYGATVSVDSAAP